MTRISSCSASCIDHVYSNLDHYQLKNFIIQSDASDHFSTLTSISNFKLNDKDADVYIRKTRLSTVEWQMLNNELEHILDLESSHLNTQILDVNHYASMITESYQYLLDKYMPLVKLSRKELSFHKKPWISSALKTSIKRKNDLYSASRFKNDPESNSQYTKYRNLLTKLIRKAKNNYYFEKLLLYGQDKAKTWQFVNEISNRRRKTSQNIPNSLKKENGDSISDPKEIAQLLNNHFGTVGQKMADKFTDTSANTSASNNDPLDFVNVSHLNSSNDYLNDQEKIYF